MREMINVLDVNIEHCSAKQALKAAVEYMDTPATSVIDLVTIEALMYARDDTVTGKQSNRAIWYFRGRKDILEGGRYHRFQKYARDRVTDIPALVAKVSASESLQSLFTSRDG